MLCDFTHMLNLKKDTNKQNKNKLIDTENRLMVTRGERGCGGCKMDEGGQLYDDEWQLDLWW